MPTLLTFKSTCLLLTLALAIVLAGGTVEAAPAGALSITSDPSAAAVYVDGRHVGQTPTSIADLTAGDHRVRVVKAGYLEHSRVVTVNGGKTGALAVLLTARAAQATAGAAGLTIVVIAGEGAVNIIQQKTAVAPVVEVRDRNNQPVAGALVRFAIQGGRASFDGARAVTLVTNAAGRAAATTLTPTASGAVEIGASASFQGQVATATIVQTNFVTVAAATAAATATAAGVATAAGGAAAGGATAGAAAGGAAAGGGIGLSATTLAIVGGAVAGGTVVTTRVVGIGGGGGVKIYEGDIRFDQVMTVRDVRSNGSVSFSCTATFSLTGEGRAEIEEHEDGTITGTVSANGYQNEISRTCPFSSQTNEHLPFGSGNATGTTASFQASGAEMSFAGSLNSGVITGTYTLSPSTYVSPTLNQDGSRREQVVSPSSAQVRLTN